MIWYDLLEESQCQEQQFDSIKRDATLFAFLKLYEFAGALSHVVNQGKVFHSRGGRPLFP